MREVDVCYPNLVFRSASHNQRSCIRRSSERNLHEHSPGRGQVEYHN